MDTEQNTAAAPSGVVAIMTAPDGHVVASVSEFNQGRYSGFSLLQSQENRAERALHWAVIDAYCSMIIVKAISDHQAREICRELERKHGHRQTIIPVGHAKERGDER